MIIDFKQVDEQTINRFRGGEGDTIAKMFADDLTRVMLGRLSSGASIGMHTHEDSCEVIYVLSGKGTAACGGEREPLSPGICHYCQKGHEHSIINDGGDGELIFFAVIPKQ